jgi:hypothetical protein
MNVSEVLRVVDQIIPLLADHGHPDKADWLVAKAALLRDPNLPEVRAWEILHEFHRLVPGMGGLMDLWLTGPNDEEELGLRKFLRQFGDELYDLTR